MARLWCLFFGFVYLGTIDSYGMFMWDEAEYACLARSISRGQGFSISGKPDPLRPPILPLTGAAVISLSAGCFSDRPC